PSSASRYWSPAPPVKRPVKTPSSSRSRGCAPSDVCTSTVSAFGAHTVSSTVPSSHGIAPNVLAPDSVRLHAARVGAGLQQPIGFPADRRHAAERPCGGGLDLVSTPPQPLEGLVAGTILDGEVSRPRRARIERARERLRAVARRVRPGLETP